MDELDFMFESQPKKQINNSGIEKKRKKFPKLGLDFNNLRRL